MVMQLKKGREVLRSSRRLTYTALHDTIYILYTVHVDSNRPHLRHLYPLFLSTYSSSYLFATTTSLVISTRLLAVEERGIGEGSGGINGWATTEDKRDEEDEDEATGADKEENKSTRAHGTFSNIAFFSLSIQ